MRTMRTHFQREGARADRAGVEDCPYILALVASLAGFDDPRFAYVVLPGVLSEAARRAVDRGDRTGR